MAHRVCLIAPPLSPPHVSSFAFTDSVRIGQIGVGRWGRNLLRNLVASPTADVVAVCDPSDPALAEAARLAPRARPSRSADAVLGDDAVEAVVVATETPLHFEHAQAALRAGKHVFVEKPLAQTVGQAEQLVALAAEHDRRLMVGHLLRYHPAFQRVEEIAARGDLGELRYLYSVRVNLGVVRQHENAFDSLAPHDLAVARALLGDATAVTAQGRAFLQPGVEDVVFATVEYAGGALAHVHASWLDPHKVRRTTLVGSRQMAVVDDQEPAEKLRVYDKGVDTVAGSADVAGALAVRTGEIAVPFLPPAEPLRLEVEEFLSAIREHRAPLTDGVDGLEVVRVLEAARRVAPRRAPRRDRTLASSAPIPCEAGGGGKGNGRKRRAPRRLVRHLARTVPPAWPSPRVRGPSHLARSAVVPGARPRRAQRDYSGARRVIEATFPPPPCLRPRPPGAPSSSPSPCWPCPPPPRPPSSRRPRAARPSR